MPTIPSGNYLAKDVIGRAMELVSTEEARQLLRPMQINYYNMAIAEIFILSGYIDAESWLKNGSLTPVAGDIAKHYTAPISSFTDLDKVVEIEVYSTSGGGAKTFYEIYRKDLSIFNRHKRLSSATYPYNDSFIYTEKGNVLHFLQGEDITVPLNILTFKIDYRRMPVVLDSANYLTAYIDVPDKYVALLENRIASYAEIRKGITDQALKVVESTYGQLLKDTESLIKAKVIDTIQSNNEAV